MRTIVAFLAMLALVCQPLGAQTMVMLGAQSGAIEEPGEFLFSGIVSDDRAYDWENPARGALGGVIPARTTICSTLSAGSTLAQINTAINNCPAEQTVLLEAGTYNINGMLSWGSSNNNVTLRGAGADLTILDFSGAGTCSGEGASVCVSAGWLNQDSPQNSTTWTAGYSVGATTITVGNATNMSVGQIIILDQLDDSVDGGGIYVCAEAVACSDEGGNSPGRPGRGQMHVARVVSKSGNDVTIHPPLTMPNWRSGQTPGVWWAASFPVMEGIGIEDLTIDATDAANRAGIVFMTVHDSWAKGVRVLNADRAHVWLYRALQMTVRDSYFYGGQGDHSESYGVEGFGTGWNLIENNIFNHVTGPIKHNGSETGSVVAYNFSIDDNYTAEGSAPQWMIPTIAMHEVGISYLLHEGNDGLGYLHDDIHGTTHFITAFRNFFYGDTWNSPAKSDNTAVINLAAFARFYNIVGNVLGRTGYYNTYQTLISFGDTSIYNLGWPNDVTTDARVSQTMLRWGNYDTVNNAVRFQSSEVPTADAFYPNAVPASQTLPPSFYLASGPPSFWATPWGTPSWPPIGPDVSSGNVSGWGGHANKIPARLCYENTTKVSDVLQFNADDCYL